MTGIKRYFQAYKDYKQSNIGDAGYMEFEVCGNGTNPSVGIQSEGALEKPLTQRI